MVSVAGHTQLGAGWKRYHRVGHALNPAQNFPDIFSDVVCRISTRWQDIDAPRFMPSGPERVPDLSRFFKQNENYHSWTSDNQKNPGLLRGRLLYFCLAVQHLSQQYSRLPHLSPCHDASGLPQSHGILLIAFAPFTQTATSGQLVSLSGGSCYDCASTFAAFDTHNAVAPIHGLRSDYGADYAEAYEHCPGSCQNHYHCCQFKTLMK
jgi:hypothetical protein